MRNKQLFGWIAFFLLLYTTADVTIFEYYTGNETLGIRTFQISGETKKINQISDKLTSLASNNSQNSAPDQQSNVPDQHEGCICCCAHSLPSYYFIETARTIVYREQEYLFLPRSLHSSSHPLLLFRPPRTI